MTWQEQAACAGQNPDWWFAHPMTSEYRRARQICNHCPVRFECLEYALTNYESGGLWGGADDHQRKMIRRARRKADREQLAREITA